VKSRKKLNVMLAAFLAVFVAGAAFAFISGGPLVFQGTVGVDALLQVEIMDNTLVAEHNGAIARYELVRPKDQGYFQINLDVAFDEVVQSAGFLIQIKNTGSIPAYIRGIALENYTNWGQNTPLYNYLTISGHTANWERAADPISWEDAEGLTLYPGQTRDITIGFNFDATLFSGWSIYETMTFQINLDYAPVLN